MTSKMSALANLLVEQEKAMEELAQALTDEQRAIIGMDLGQLTESRCRKEQAAAVLEQLKTECGELMRGLGSELGVANVRNLSDLIAAADAAEQEELRRLQRRQVMLANGVDRQMALNRKMLVKSIGMVENSMALFGRLLGDCATYGAQGRVTSGGARGSIFRREI